MSDKISDGGSLIFYAGKNYAGTALSVSHGDTGVLAASTTSWNVLSVAMSGMQAFVSSAVNTADASVVYLGHQEDQVTISQTDLTLLYPSSDQFPLNYLGLDPAQAVMVWLDVDADQTAPNAVASTALVGASATTLTTLSLPGRKGLLGCVAKIEGSSVVASCAYGDYNTADGTVTWDSTGTLILEYNGGGITLINGGVFPVGWTFGDPQMQGDGSWVVTLNCGSASDTLSSVTANPDTITDDGVSTSVITATVVDGNDLPVGGVTVNWNTTLGILSMASSVTGDNGMTSTQLKDSGTPGTATVTASLDSGSQRSTTVAVTDDSAKIKVYAIDNSSPNDISNKISVYCNELLPVKITVDGQAEFVGGVWTKTYATTLSPFGPNIINLTDSVIEVVNVTVTPDDITILPVSTSLSFVQRIELVVGSPDEIGYIVYNKNVPADGISTGGIHVSGSIYGKIDIVVGGSAYLSESLDKEKSIDGGGWDIVSLDIEIVDLIAETVEVTVSINDRTTTVLEIDFYSIT
ncbi:Ig-like domain-containing protein [Pseudescherichia vulneris]